MLNVEDIPLLSKNWVDLKDKIEKYNGEFVEFEIIDVDASCMLYRNWVAKPNTKKVIAEKINRKSYTSENLKPIYRTVMMCDSEESRDQFIDDLKNGIVKIVRAKVKLND